MARPTKLSPQVQDTILGLIRKGLNPERAAHAAGVAPSTFYRWMRDGEHPAPPDPDDYTLPQLRAIAADQDISLDHLGRRPTRRQVAALLEAPTPFRQFRESVKRAEAEAEAFILERCRTVGGDDWRMWMTILERRFDGWARPVGQPESSPSGLPDRAAALAQGKAVLKVLDGGAG